MTGAETAWRTLNMEAVDEPCIVASWMMKRDFFRHYAGVRDIYADFDNNGRDKAVDFTFSEIRHNLLLFRRWHLAM